MKRFLFPFGEVFATRTKTDSKKLKIKFFVGIESKVVREGPARHTTRSIICGREQRPRIWRRDVGDQLMLGLVLVLDFFKPGAVRLWILAIPFKSAAG